MGALFFDSSSIGKLGFFCTKGTNCFFQRQDITHIEIIDYPLINRGFTCKKEVGQMFIPKSKLGLLYMDFCVEVEY